MASEALRRAVAAAEEYYSLTPSGAIRNGLRAALDLTDEALVSRWEKVSGHPLTEAERVTLAAMASDAIAALRDHICGEAP